MMSLKIHLDTDIGGDMDDLCALAMLLKWPDLDITGITTTAEEKGRRAGFVDYTLKVAGRTEIPFAAGADCAGGYFRYSQLGYPPDDNWPEPIESHPNPLDDALELLKSSIEQGATLVGIGPFTNFMLVDQKYPGILKDANLLLMGGYVYDIPMGYPQFSRQDDWNMQMDIQATQYLFEHANPTLVPLTLTAQTAFRHSDLARLKQAGRLGELLVRQAEVFARTENLAGKYGATSPKLPADFINFHHDPLACAIALGWDEGLKIETLPLKFDVRDTYLYEIPDPAGRLTNIVTQVYTYAFNQYWLNTLTY
jgi:inosine-uridine nucleoside N-ribohydrolase